MSIDWPPPFMMHRSDGLSIVERRGFRAYHAGEPFAEHNPVHGGVGLRPRPAMDLPFRGIAGTIGGVASKGGKYYIVINEHAVEPGELIYTTTEGDPVAHATPGNLITSKGLDAAAVLATVPVSFDIPGIGVTTGEMKPKTGMKVVKVGALTGLTHGVISKSPSNVNIRHVARDTFFIRTPGGDFSHNGDSGSLIIEPKSRKVVGILYGGFVISGSEWASAHDATVVAKDLGISFAGKPGTLTNLGVKPTPTPAPDGAPTMPTQVASQDQNPIAALIQIIINIINNIISMLTNRAPTTNAGRSIIARGYY